MNSGSCSGLHKKAVTFLIFLIWASDVLGATGVICTLPNECERLQELIRLPTTQDIAGRKFVKGRIENVEVILVKSPMGKSQNAITSTVLLQQFAVGRIISIGTAGSLTNELPVGSVFTTNHVSAHDEGRYLSIGFATYKGVINSHPLEKKSRHGVIVYEGHLASGDQFIADADRAKFIRKLTGGHAVDTNAIAIKSVCLSFGVQDCEFIRYISDSADDKSPADFNTATRADISRYVRFIKATILSEVDA